MSVHQATRLMRGISEVSEDLQREMRRLLDVNELDFRAMEHLLKDGSVTPSELAGRLGISPALASVVVDRLGAVGHAHRHRDPADGRRVLVTPAQSSAREAMGHLLPMIAETDRAIRELPPEHQDAVVAFLTATLTSMTTRLGELRELPSPQRGPRT